MREIKFRAWDEEQKRMYQPEEIEQCCIVSISGYGRLSIAIENPDWVELKKLQFTGLKDKNGKEIYEGYIVQGYFMKGSKANVKIKNKVEYNHSGFGIRDKDNIFMYLIYGRELEVIGNIYENPELFS